MGLNSRKICTLSVDVDSLGTLLKFHGQSPSQVIGPDPVYQTALPRFLQLFEECQVKATFFIVAEIYEWYPEIIKEIKKQGHEIAYHTHTHPLVKKKEILEKELLLSKKFINDFKPAGFRAPQIYLQENALESLEKRGFTYSSSSYDEYVITKFGKITEIPVSVITFRKQPFSRSLPKPLTFKLLLRKIPIGSGLSIALIGSRTSLCIRKLNARRIPTILFVHPWQLYQTPEITSVRFKLNLLLRNPLCLPYTRNIRAAVEKLFKAHQFTSFHRYFYEQQRVLGQ